MGDKRFAVKFGGPSSVQHDTRIKVKYFNAFGNANANNITDSENVKIFKWSGGKVEDYSDIFNNYIEYDETKNIFPIINSFKEDIKYSVQPYSGLAPASLLSSEKYSIYRREYNVYMRPGLKMYGYYYDGEFHEKTSDVIMKHIPGVNYIDLDTQYCYQFDVNINNYIMVEKVKVYKGNWEPVLINSNLISMYDYNISNNRSYQYIMFLNYDVPTSDDEVLKEATQIFANSESEVWQPDPVYPGQGKLIQGDLSKSSSLGAPVSLKWNEWSICELTPEKNDLNIPFVKNIYSVDSTQIWRFKFSLETGSEKQNISRSEIKTLGQFSKVGYGNTNYSSGDVTALMGSEIVYGSKNQYIERMNSSRISPLSTNEKTEMLKKWREFVASKNPKLLKDMKGQVWIVQIFSSENTVKNFYNTIPDTINFSWQQIEDAKNVVIYSKITTQPQEQQAEGSLPYEPIF